MPCAGLVLILRNVREILPPMETGVLACRRMRTSRFARMPREASPRLYRGEAVCPVGAAMLLSRRARRKHEGAAERCRGHIAAAPRRRKVRIASAHRAVLSPRAERHVVEKPYQTPSISSPPRRLSLIA